MKIKMASELGDILGVLQKRTSSGLFWFEAGVQKETRAVPNCNNLESMASAGDCLHGCEYGFLNHNQAREEIGLSLYFYTSRTI